MGDKNGLLTKYICNQFDYINLKKMVEIFLNMIKVLQMRLKENNNCFQITANYDLVCQGSSNVFLNTSKIESLMIKNYNTEEKIKECIDKFIYGYNQLNHEEKIVFYYTFFTLNTNDLLKDKLNISTSDIYLIRKSAVIKFSLILGLDSLTHIVLDKGDLENEN